MTEKQVTIKNRAGIHMRPAGLIAKVASRFVSHISMINEADNENINAKSIMGIITLCARYNTTLLVRAEGPDEADAVQAIFDLFEQRFEED
ncbi:MAG: HPr family phosphocarrier protein [Spirochaetia bacterium]|jgi:phosphocarrier protein|nr:HPr family phosphocarrier protein [Spirochaetia bacterium]